MICGARRFPPSFFDSLFYDQADRVAPFFTWAVDIGQRPSLFLILLFLSAKG